MQIGQWLATLFTVGGLAGLCMAAPPAPPEESTVAGSPAGPSGGGSGGGFSGASAPRPHKTVQHFEMAASPPNVLYFNEAVPVGSSRVGVVVRDSADDVQEQGTPWIGLQLGPVPAALAAHLELSNRGLIVRNVFKGSPADQAGLQRYDVLLKADDADVVGPVESFSKTIRQRKIHDTVHLTLIRAGKNITQDVQLSAAPPAENLATKFPEEPDVLYRKDFGLRGRILRPGPNGWEMQDLGELPDIEQFFREQWRSPDGRMGGGSGGTMGKGMRRDAAPDHARRVDRDGVTIDVRRLKDGSIQVRREKRAGSQPADGENARMEVVVHPNMAELRKRDPEAATLLESQTPPVPPVPPVRDPKELERTPRRPAPQDEKWREWRERFFQGPLGPSPDGSPVPPAGQPAPSVRFDVQTDGRITVHKREGDAEINMSYSSLEEFKKSAPQLYGQFERMQQSLK